MYTYFCLCDQCEYNSRSMINSRRLLRLKTNEHLPVILLAIGVVYVIHLCNLHDQTTANQYIMEDNHTEYHQRCPLYPNTLQG